jgi:hypothetical protein
VLLFHADFLFFFYCCEFFQKQLPLELKKELQKYIPANDLKNPNRFQICLNILRFLKKKDFNFPEMPRKGEKKNNHQWILHFAGNLSFTFKKKKDLFQKPFAESIIKKESEENLKKTFTSMEKSGKG